MLKMKQERSGYILLAVGLGLAAVGLLRDEAVAVFYKAITLCLQCIGIG